MKLINHEAIDSQKEHRQPSWVLLVVAYVLSAHSTLMLYKLADALWPGWSAWYGNHYDVARLVGVGIQVTIVTVFSVVIMRRYGGALYAGFALDRAGLWRILKTGTVVSAPLAICYLWQASRSLGAMVILIDGIDKGSPAGDFTFWARLHQAVWQPLPWGIDRLGVILSTTVCLTSGPFLEEWLISGYACNKFARRLPKVVAALLCAAVFAAIHLHAAGLSSQLLLIFFLGCTCVLARLVAGSWVAGLLAHCIINLTILAPKWVVALIWFQLAPKA